MSNELFIYKLKHQVVHHQCIAEPVFFLCFRKPDPDLKDGVWGLLFLLIEFLVFLGLAVVWEYWTEPDRICTVIFIYFFLVVTWYKSGLHLPALWNYLGLKSLTEAMPLGPSPRPGTCLSHILTQWKKLRSLNVVFVDIASSWWYKPGVMLFLWKLQHTCMISVTNYWEGLSDRMLFRHNFFNCKYMYWLQDWIHYN